MRLEELFVTIPRGCESSSLLRNNSGNKSGVGVGYLFWFSSLLLTG
jgi:hypothetical protein